VTLNPFLTKKLVKEGASVPLLVIVLNCLQSLTSF
jgi:hypothetical protein